MEEKKKHHGHGRGDHSGSYTALLQYIQYVIYMHLPLSMSIDHSSINYWDDVCSLVARTENQSISDTSSFRRDLQIEQVKTYTFTNRNYNSKAP